MSNPFSASPLPLITRLYDMAGNILLPDEQAELEISSGPNQGVSLTNFSRSMYSPYVHTPFQALVDEKLAAVARYVESGGKEGIGRLMIFMPPRSGKSLKTSKLFPAWFIGRNPDKRLIMASYGGKLAARNSRTVRNLIKSKRYTEFFPGVRLSDDTASATEWDIAEHEGGAIAAGVGGSIVGHGANCFLIDDPIKSRAEAESRTYRERLIDWYGDAYTRLQEPGAAVILMHTRWHEEDLAGYLLKEEPNDWEVLCLPAIAEENDPLGRRVGEALWPERYDEKKLEKIRVTLGEYRFAAEYQQSPKPKSGGLFDPELIEIIDFMPDCIQEVRFYDLAVTKKKSSDYTAGIKLGLMQDEEIAVLDMWRRQLTAPDIQEGIVQNAMIDGTAVKIILEAEKAGIIELDYLLRDPRLRGYTIEAKPPVGDKYTRAGPFASRVKGRKVKMVRGAWNRAYLDELAMFPAGHDDQVDASSGGYDELVNGTSAAVIMGQTNVKGRGATPTWNTSRRY